MSPVEPAGQYEPAAQFVHDDAPGALCVPAAQFVHVASAAVVAPVGPYLPAAHAVPVHAVASGLLPYKSLLQPPPLCRPAGQSAQALQELCVAVPP